MADDRGRPLASPQALVDLSGVASEPPPLHVPPMHAQRDGLPPRDEHQWAYQPCWRGQRVLVHVHGALTSLRVYPAVRIVGPTGLDLTDLLPELFGLADAGPPRPAVIDGIVTVPPGGDLSPGQTQTELLHRLGTRDPAFAEEAARTRPVHLLVIDVIHLDGRRVGDLPYSHRRDVLVERLADGPTWSVPPHFLHAGRALAALAHEWHTDELVAKRVDSRYFPGMLSPVWLRAPLPRIAGTGRR